jgi:hypothetical protein
MLTLTALPSISTAAPVGLSVEALRDPNVIVCPYCHKPIVPGKIRKDAENTLWMEMGGYLDVKGISYTSNTKATIGVDVFIYRFEERSGGNIAAEKPASVAFHVHLLEGDKVSKVVVFDETQEPLFKNILELPEFLRRRAQWVKAADLAREGVHEAIDSFIDDLMQSK